MKKLSDEINHKGMLREKLIGLGEHSLRKNYYPELQRKEEDLKRFRTLLDQSGDYVFLAMADNGQLVDMNRSYCQVTGRSHQEVLARETLYTLVAAPGFADLIFRAMEAVSRENEQELMLTELSMAGRTPLPVEIRYRVVWLGKDAYVVVVARDITERLKNEAALRELNEQLEIKVEIRTQELLAMNQETQAINAELLLTLEQLRKMQDQLVQAEKMAALAGLVAGVAHEINTPVGLGITLASHLEERSRRLRRRLELGTMTRQEFLEYLEDSEEMAARLLANMNRAAEMVKSFKQVSADEIQEKRREFPVREYLEEIVASLQTQLEKGSHRVEIDCDSRLVLYSFPGSFAQILTNLLKNSMTHGYDVGDAGLFLIRARLEGCHFCLTYRDDGKGIAPEILPRIFDPFFTSRRSSGNTGLGLHILYNIVRQVFRGTVECQSGLGQGTVFEIRFPLEIPPGGS